MVKTETQTRCIFAEIPTKTAILLKVHAAKRQISQRELLAEIIEKYCNETEQHIEKYSL